MKFYFIITTSLISENFETRKKDYINAIKTLETEVNKYKGLDKYKNIQCKKPNIKKYDSLWNLLL
jgi:hypothetical protein